MNAMREQMLQLIGDRTRLAVASRAAETAALDYSWPAYRARVVGLLQAIHNSRIS
jgi:hypothetical protein